MILCTVRTYNYDNMQFERSHLSLLENFIHAGYLKKEK